MNVFVASTPDEAKRSDDFSYTVAGELVWGGFAVCDCPDCGCERSMAGMASSKGTTTFKVRFDPDMTRDLYRQAFRDNATREGWIEPTNPVELAEIDAIADEHRDLAAQFEPGTELRRVKDRLRLRLVARH